MTTISKLVTKGLREAGLIGKGEDPDGAQYDEGLDLLQGIYSSFFGNELGEQLTSYNYGSYNLGNSYAVSQDHAPDMQAIFVPVNARIVFNINTPQSLYIQPNPMDGARLGVVDNVGNFASAPVTLNANGRQIEGAASVVLNTNGLNREWFYRADLGQWTKINDLVGTDLSPLPREFDDLLTTALAIRVAPRFGAQTAQETSAVLQNMLKKFRARYRQNMEQTSEDGLIRLPSNHFWPWIGNSTAIFNRGRP